ncbi:MAG TPA: HlyD family secretion protein [Geobacteraceae bacterium]
MKRIVLAIIGIVILAAGCGFGWYWISKGRFIETTDNAYIRSEITQISTKVQGYVKDVPAEDNMPVAAGAILVRIEDVEFRLRLEHGRQKLEERKAAQRVGLNRTRQQESRIDACKAALSAAEAELNKRTSDLSRIDRLYPRGIVSAQDYDTVVTTEKKARAEVRTARANLEMAEREQEVLFAEERRLGTEVHQQEEELKLLLKELDDTVIRAPIAGVVGNRRVRVGQYVKPGTLLLAVIPRNDIWVEANFKEVQVTRMHQGQRVSIEVDTFPGRVLAGRIESLSPASGAEYSLIPPENASGNFTKVVQRIPVKIRFEPGQPLLQDLRSGMSVVVNLDTRSDPAGSSMASRSEVR